MGTFDYLKQDVNKEEIKKFNDNKANQVLDQNFKPTFLREEDITIHSELELYIRKQTPEELEQFKSSLKEEGIRDAIVVTLLDGNNVLIDGHHRFRVGKEVGITDFPTKQLELGTLEDIKIWMLKNQLGRRNLTDAERIDIADKLTEFLIPIAKEKQLYKGKKTVSPNLAKQKNVDRISEISRLSGASTGNVKKLRKIKKERSQEDVDKVLSGEVSIHKSYTELGKQNLKDSSLQSKLDIDGINKEIKTLCQLSVLFIESANFILSSFIKESINNFRVSKDNMKDVEEALEILNNKGALKEEKNILRLEYFETRTLKMIRSRYHDWNERYDEFGKHNVPYWEKCITLKSLQKRLSEAKIKSKK